MCVHCPTIGCPMMTHNYECRRLRLWYTSLALHNSKGRRNRVAFVFERWALSIAFVIYCGMILGIFLPKSVNNQWLPTSFV